MKMNQCLLNYTFALCSPKHPSGKCLSTVNRNSEGNRIKRKEQNNFLSVQAEVNSLLSLFPDLLNDNIMFPSYSAYKH